jgi:peptide/nickel transport system substrate-binding protein
MRRSKRLIAVVALAAVLSACSAKSTTTTTSTGDDASGTDGPHKQGGTVTIANTGGQTWPCQFNPFNPAVNLEALGFIYEPLVYVSVVGGSKETPMLATGYEWGADSKSFVFTIREGV